MNEQLIPEIKFDEQGLVPAIVREEGTGEILMMAWMNRQSLSLSLETGYTHFWSRSRRTLWKKGETSGHLQKITEIRYDCDADTLLVTVEQTGPACHTGHKSCFFRTLSPKREAGGPGAEEAWQVFRKLEKVIEDRKAHPKEGSYTNRLLADGGRMAKEKVLEESREVVEAAGEGDRDHLRYEAADLLYHLMALLSARGLLLRDVGEELERRFGNPPKKDSGTHGAGPRRK